MLKPPLKFACLSIEASVTTGLYHHSSVYQSGSVKDDEALAEMKHLMRNLCEAWR